MHIHNLDGCAPVPLAHYLKALGILRLVAEQADPTVRGWWEGERFRLMTALSREELEDFFLERYEPTPLTSPWNKGSGFFYDKDPGLTPAETAPAARFARLREGIAAGRVVLQELTEADQAIREIKAETKDKLLTKALRDVLRRSPDYKKRLADAEKRFKTLKAKLIPHIRLAWRGPHREWMDAAMVLDDEGTPRFPALLGTGGNDGRLDFSNNFFQRIKDVFDLADAKGAPRPLARTWLSSALWASATSACQSGNAVGQYLPGFAGGANSGNGPDADSQINPVDFILMMEGALLFTMHANRRLGASESSRAAAPFAVGAQGAGYASAAGTDEGARGEQWMPLWSQPILLGELRHLLSEGRAQIGAKPAREPLDLARAIARLGTARGISAFQRYGYIERNGQSNLAVPLGRFFVPKQDSPPLACLDDLDAWLPRLRRQARDKHAPARLRLAERRLADALFAVAQHPGEPGRWQSVLLALADVEAVQVSGSGFQAGPIPRLRPEWVAASDDRSAELRLGLACALQAAGFTRERKPIDAVRAHWLPMERGRYATTGSGSQTRLQAMPQVVMQGRSGMSDAIALVGRRLVEASQKGQRRLPLVAAYCASATAADLGSLLAGKIDLDRALALARTLTAIDRAQWANEPIPPRPPHRDTYPDDAWLAIRLSLLPWPLRLPQGGEIRIGTDPAVFRRLAAGDAASAVTLSMRRLAAAGIRSAVRVATVPPETARLWAAALAFPISQNTAAEFLRRLDPA